MSWEVVAGVVEWWSDEGVRDVGRFRTQQARGNSISRAAIPVGTIDRVRAAFVAQRSPWRLTELALECADEMTPAIASWAEDATAVLKGSPAEQHVVGPRESWGDLGVRGMLSPEALESIVPKPWPEQFEVSGHKLERDPSVLPEFVSVGTSYYEVRYNGNLDIITAWTAVIDDDAAQRILLSQVTSIDPRFNAPVAHPAADG